MNVMGNIPAMSAGKAVEELSALYINAIKNDVAVSSLPSVFLWGPPGVGKSDLVYEIADTIEKRTQKKVLVTDIRLLLFSPVDLKGVPAPDEERKFSQWLLPKIFDLPEDEDYINMIFLDELSAAPPSIQATAYQITLNHMIGEHKLPDNTIVMAAGNRVTDRSVAYRMPNALANRLMHFDITVNFESWREWAVHHGINPFVLGYLTYDRSKLYESESGSDDVAFPTPRSWTFVSDILNSMNGVKPRMLYHLISGCIGCGLALEFVNWCDSWKDIVPAEYIFEGRKITYPRNPDSLHAMISAVTAYAADRKAELTNHELTNCCRFAEGLPVDFKSVLYLNLLAIRELKLKLINIKPFRNWLEQNKKYMEDL